MTIRLDFIKQKTSLISFNCTIVISHCISLSLKLRLHHFFLLKWWNPTETEKWYTFLQKCMCVSHISVVYYEVCDGKKGLDFRKTQKIKSIWSGNCLDGKDEKLRLNILDISLKREHCNYKLGLTWWREYGMGKILVFWELMWRFFLGVFYIKLVGYNWHGKNSLKSSSQTRFDDMYLNAYMKRTNDMTGNLK